MQCSMKCLSSAPTLSSSAPCLLDTPVVKKSASKRSRDREPPQWFTQFAEEQRAANANMEKMANELLSVSRERNDLLRSLITELSKK